MIKTRIFTALFVLGMTASAHAQKSSAPKEKIVTTPSGLQYVDEVIGTGPLAEVGKTASVRCEGKLKDSSVFWATTAKFNYDMPLEFKVGSVPLQMIQGFDEGVRTMHVGGRRKLVIPPNLGYGDRGRAPAVPPKATLIFDIQLLEVK